MSDEVPLAKTHSLGSFLREQREQHGVSIENVAETTKISLPILRAIEDDNFERMPAEAFCRGFYSIYAKYLKLDAEEILSRYRQSRGIAVVPSTKQAESPVSKGQRFSNFAQPSSVSPAAGTTVVALLLLIVLSGICWYLNWNPINYISTILTPQETLFMPAPADGIPEPVAEKTILPDTTSDTKRTETDKNSTQQSQKNTPLDTPMVTLYDLEVTFNNSGILKVTLDDGFVLDKHFAAGETLQWEVEKKIVLDMPETIRGRFSLNGIEIPLPPAENGRRKLSLPEDLLD